MTSDEMKNYEKRYIISDNRRQSHINDPRVIFESRNRNNIPYYLGETIKKSLNEQFLKYSKVIKRTEWKIISRVVSTTGTNPPAVEFVRKIIIEYYGYLILTLEERCKCIKVSAGIMPGKGSRFSILDIKGYTPNNEYEHMMMRTNRKRIDLTSDI